MYATQSIDEAAYLVAEGISPRSTRPPGPDEEDLVTFLFPESDELDAAVEAWDNRYIEPVETDVGRFADARHDLFRKVREVRR